MFARSISSLSIPPSSKLALQRAGFKSVADLGNLSAEKLSEGYYKYDPLRFVLIDLESP